METRLSETWVAQTLPAVGGHCTDACLILIYPAGVDMGRRYTLAPGRHVVGRSEDVDIPIADHSVSRRHAVIEADEDGCTIRDLKSRNGTLVNDCTVRTSCRLEDGDYVAVGNAIFRYLAGGNIESGYHEEIHRLAILDGLTQLHNRRSFDEFLDRELARSVRHDRPLSVLMIDIDRFKKINDELGHLAGDHVLRQLAARLRTAVRAEDMLARFGGEELCVVCAETTRDRAADFGERLRRMVDAEPFFFEDAELRVTVSIGVSTLQGPNETPATLLNRADSNLYRAKATGRNAVVG